MLDATRPLLSFRLLQDIQQSGIPVVPVVTMLDLLDEKSRSKLAFLWRRSYVVNARTGKGIEQLIDHISACSGRMPPYNCPSPICAGCPLWTSVYERKVPDHNYSVTEKVLKIDKWLLHPVIGYVIMVILLLAFFHILFSVGGLLSDYVDSLLGQVGNRLSALFGNTPAFVHLVDVFISASSAVLVFLPQIALLFVIIAILEDTGYLARMNVLVDIPFRKIGLDGSVVLPVLSGFACNIPAILGVNAVRNGVVRERLIWLLPLVPCSARLLVFVMLISLLIPSNMSIVGVNAQAVALAAVYIFPMLIAGVLSYVFKLSHKEDMEKVSNKVLELPPYQVPSWRTVLKLSWIRTSAFLRRAGKVIFIVAVLLWLLGHLRFHGDIPWVSFTEEITESILAEAGKALEDLFEPLGFNWRICVALLSAFWAREVFIITLGAAYGLSADHESKTLLALLSSDPTVTMDVIVALLVFLSIAILCMSTVAVLMEKHRRWYYAVVQLIASVIIAYVFGWLAKEATQMFL